MAPRDPVEALRDAHAAVTDGLLTYDEACEALRISKWTLHRYLREGKLTSILIGPRGYIPEAAVWSYIDNLRAKAQAVKATVG